MKKNLPVIIIALVLIILIVSVCRVTIIPDEVPQTVVNESGEVVVVEKLTVAQQYCEDNWDSKMVPTLEEKAQPVETVIESLKADINAAGEKFGTRANETSAWNFSVKGPAKVIGIETPEKATKTRLLLDVAPYDGEADCKLQVSTVLKTNAVRDAVGFLRLDDFKDQVEFAELTKSFNAKIQDTVISKIEDVTALEGKEIDFIGAAAVTKLEDPDDMLIIPVKLSVVGD
jgi:predicted lipoprotein